ncbi:UPF0323 family lipoprotein [Campylobacter sp. VBCF_06 NA8]|uniref:UPF0323 family lipoprotein n=1 Tax=Campylobacter sp. VBCF_06 NA8 TaxID=2983822 RepID=UPI0022E9F177|nr:UPF0323 family lipoprotein [Campylobacter sp. VBCF_06 NA8]MDA3045599.1 UPF0323 family lipoprotein [Campylobacter sp. VBCF_06 NA8]
MKIRKIASYAIVGGFGLILSGALAGCERENTGSELRIQEGALVRIEEVAPGKYKILEEFPSEKTQIILKSLDGSERILSEAETNALLAEENAKIDAGTSNLTNQNAEISSGGYSLGEAILASAAGAIIGSWIGSKLFGSPAYQAHRQTAFKNPSAYSRSVNSFKEAKANNAKAKSGKSGFFGSKSGEKSAPAKSGGSAFGG